MKDTGFWVDESKADRVTKVHTYDADKKIKTAPTQGDPTSKPVFLSGGGGLLSTTGDYFKFAQMVLNGGTGERQAVPEDVNRGVDAHQRARAGRAGRSLWAQLEHQGMGFGLDFAIIMDPAKAKTPRRQELLLLGRRVRHVVLARSHQRHGGRRHDPKHRGQRADRGSPQVRPLSRQLVYARWSIPRSDVRGQAPFGSAIHGLARVWSARSGLE